MNERDINVLAIFGSVLAAFSILCMILYSITISNYDNILEQKEAHTETSSLGEFESALDAGQVAETYYWDDLQIIEYRITASLDIWYKIEPTQTMETFTSLLADNPGVEITYSTYDDSMEHAQDQAQAWLLCTDLCLFFSAIVLATALIVFRSQHHGIVLHSPRQKYA